MRRCPAAGRWVVVRAMVVVLLRLRSCSSHLSFRLLNDARRRLRLIGCRTSFSLSPIELNWDN